MRNGNRKTSVDGCSHSMTPNDLFRTVRSVGENNACVRELAGHIVYKIISYNSSKTDADFIFSTKITLLGILNV